MVSGCRWDTFGKDSYRPTVILCELAPSLEDWDEAKLPALIAMQTEGKLALPAATPAWTMAKDIVRLVFANQDAVKLTPVSILYCCYVCMLQLLLLTQERIAVLKHALRCTPISYTCPDGMHRVGASQELLIVRLKEIMVTLEQIYISYPHIVSVCLICIYMIILLLCSASKMEESLLKA